MLKGIFIAIGITIGVLFIPLVHFVAGPVSPFLGAYIGVASWKGRPSSALTTGLAFGFAIWLIFMVIAAIVLIVLGIATSAISGRTGVLIIGGAIGGACYIGALATAGAVFGAKRPPAAEKS